MFETRFGISRDPLNFGVITPLGSSGDSPMSWLHRNGVNPDIETVIAAYIPDQGIAFSRDDMWIPRAEWSKPRLGGTVVFVVLPRGGGGGGGSNPLQVVAMIAVAAFAPWAAGILAPALGITSAIGISLLGVGIAMAGSMLISRAFAPSRPQTPAQHSLPSQSPTYSNNVRGNTARLGEAIPVQYGRLRFNPDWIQSPYVEFDGNSDEYLCAIYCLGHNAYRFHDIGFGQVSLADLDISGESIEIVHADSIGEVVVSGFTCKISSSISIIPSISFRAADVSDLELTDSNWTRWFIAVPPFATANQVAFNLSFPGLFSSSGSDLTNRSVTLEFQAIRIGNAGNEINEIINLGSATFTAATVDHMRRTHRVNISVAAARYKVRVRRTNAPTVSTTARDQCYVHSVVTHNTNAHDFGKLTLIAIRVKATGQLSGNETNALYTDAESVLQPVHPVYLSTESSRSPYVAVADMIRASYGLGDSQTYWQRLPPPESLASLNDLRLSNTGERRAFNYRIDSSMKIMEAVSLALQSVFAVPYIIGGRFYFAHSLESDMISQSFSERISEYSERYTFPVSERADAIRVKYWDGRLSRENTVICKLSADDPKKLQEMDLHGITDAIDAYQRGMVELISALRQNHEVTFKTGMEGRIPQPMSRVSLPFIDAITGYFFAVVDSGDFYEVIISGVMPDFTSAAAYKITFLINEEEYSGEFFNIEGGVENKIFLSKALYDESHIMNLNRYVYGSEYQAEYVILKSKLPSYRVMNVAKSDNSISVSCIEDDPLSLQNMGHAPEENINESDVFQHGEDNELFITLTVMPIPVPSTASARVRLSWAHQDGAEKYIVTIYRGYYFPGDAANDPAIEGTEYESFINDCFIDIELGDGENLFSFVVQPAVSFGRYWVLTPADDPRQSWWIYSHKRVKHINVRDLLESLLTA